MSDPLSDTPSCLQGATCYLNSLLQTLFHIPLFRRAVYHMPTEEGEDPNSSLCVALKHLFFRLQYSPTPVSTKELISSFGWLTADAFQQHDVQELELLMYERLGEKMKGVTSYLSL
jgi:ubiquitin carboxyl-terminal hydrolase 7